MTRKAELKALFTPTQAEGKSEHESPKVAEEKANTPSRRTSGVVRSLGLNLNSLTAEAESARKLRGQLDAGTTVADLDPASVEPSFITDRLGELDDEDFNSLLQSIKANGQLVPILVRPHPDKTERFQVAYGHRRLRAAALLNAKVRALIRQMTDDQMVVAQGKENSERRDLSFIERALFAQSLEDRGFERSVLVAALSVDKSEVAKLLSVVRAIPSHIIRSIGPAPKAGRPRWLLLAELITGLQEDGILARVLGSASFKQLPTDRRFEMLYSALSRPVRKKMDSYRWNDPEGRRVVKIERGGKETRLSFDEKLEPNFGDFVARQLDDLFSQFKAAAPPESESAN
jgi:ParB family transcriptional regulator, chromosome partitioning protein